MGKIIDPNTISIAKVLLRQVKNSRYNPIITYGEVSKRINGEVRPIGLSVHLYTISNECKDIGLPLLSAIVCGVEDSLPGNGFYDTYFPGTVEDVDKMKVLNNCLNQIAACDDWSELMKSLNIESL